MSTPLAGFKGGRGWYFCWLIEQRGKEHPLWVTPASGWTKDANEALWFARKSDAEAVAAEFSANVVVCEHGFSTDQLLPKDPS